jgi:hypothetical protein
LRTSFALRSGILVSVLSVLPPRGGPTRINLQFSLLLLPFLGFPRQQGHQLGKSAQTFPTYEITAVVKRMQQIVVVYESAAKIRRRRPPGGRTDRQDGRSHTFKRLRFLWTVSLSPSLPVMRGRFKTVPPPPVVDITFPYQKDKGTKNERRRRPLKEEPPPPTRHLPPLSPFPPWIENGRKWVVIAFLGTTSSLAAAPCPIS